MPKIFIKRRVLQIIDNVPRFQQVPTCCSCHIGGYAYMYPPLPKDAKSKAKIAPKKIQQVKLLDDVRYSLLLIVER